MSCSICVILESVSNVISIDKQASGEISPLNGVMEMSHRVLECWGGVLFEIKISGTELGQIMLTSFYVFLNLSHHFQIMVM